MGRKHKPQRTCLACRTVKDKRELVRIVRTPAHQVVLDVTGKANGRGVYVCKDPACWQKSLKKERLAHALKTSVTVADVEAIRQALHAEFTQHSNA